MAKARKVPKWSEVREWMIVVTSIAAVIVAVVSLWTTAQISGIEDYLHSEISRRNSELNRISARAELLEAMANARSERLSALQTTSDSMIASSLRVQRRLIEAQGNLGLVTRQVSVAERALDQAKLRQISLGAENARQVAAFDLFKRQKAIESATFRAIMFQLYDTEPSGAAMVADIKSLRAPPGEEALQPYMARIGREITNVCPSLADWKAKLPARGVPPPRPTISYMRGTPATQIAILTKKAQDDWSKGYDAYLATERAFGDAQEKENKRLVSEATKCICQTLVDETHPARDICPTAES